MEVISKVFWCFKFFPGILALFARFYIALLRLNHNAKILDKIPENPFKKYFCNYINGYIFTANGKCTFEGEYSGVCCGLRF